MGWKKVYVRFFILQYHRKNAVFSYILRKLAMKYKTETVTSFCGEGTGETPPDNKKRRRRRRRKMKALSKKLIAWTVVLTLALALALALIPFTAPTATAWGEIGKKGYLPVISVGASHSIAVASNGDVYTWGNDDEALGLGSNVARDVPTKVPGISNVVTVSTGTYNCAAVTADGSLYTWGNNSGGMLGHGVPGSEGGEKYSPTKVQGLSNVVAVSLGSEHSAALTADGSVYIWGRNNFGTLGLDGVSVQLTPVKLPGLSNVVAIAMGAMNSAAITSDGSLYMWGSNRDGQLGNGDYDDVSNNKPEKVPGISNVVAVALGTNVSMAVTSNGDLYTWGSSTVGMLGDGKTTARSTPAKVLSSVKQPTGSSTPTPPSPPPPPPPPPSAGLVAKPTASTVLVNGENVAFDAYNIEGNNYFKLRDLAFILNGTEKQFEVGWDAANNAITLTSGKAYTPVGGEMTGKGTGDKRPTPTVSKIYLDGKEVQFTAYNIDGNNYFKLRDIGAAFDFGVTWDGAKNTIVIDTSIGYTPE